MNWNEVLANAEIENANCEYIELDGSVIDNEASLLSNEYDVAVALKKSGDGAIVVWNNNNDGSVSYSKLDELTDDMVSEILESIC